MPLDRPPAPPPDWRDQDLVTFSCRLPRAARALLRAQCPTGTRGNHLGIGRAAARAIFAFYGDPVGRRWVTEEEDTTR